MAMCGVDLEYVAENATEGVRPNVRSDYCEIVQFAACKLSGNGDIVGSFNVVVAPFRVPVLPGWLIRLTGISNEQRACGVPFLEALKQFKEFLSGGEDMWTFSGDWFVLQSNCRAHGLDNPFRSPFFRALPLVEQAGITKEDFARHGFWEVCSGGLKKVLGLEKGEAKAHDAAYDSESLALGVLHLRHALDKAKAAAGAAGTAPLPAVVKSVARMLLFPDPPTYRTASVGDGDVPVVALLGLGAMGSHMAQRIESQTGVSVRRWTRSDHAEKTHATVQDSCTDADIVLLMLSDDAATRDVASEALKHMKRGAVLVSHATVSLDLVEELSKDAEAKGVPFINCPVFGPPSAAMRGELFLVAGGDADVIQRLEDSGIFGAIGQRTLRLASPVHSALAKLCGNFLVAATIESFGTAFVVAEKTGLPPAELLDVLLQSLFGAPVTIQYGSTILSRDFTPGLSLHLGLKDLNLFLRACDASRVPAPIANSIKDHFVAVLAQHPDRTLDWTAIVLAIEAAAGLTKPYKD